MKPVAAIVTKAVEAESALGDLLVVVGILMMLAVVFARQQLQLRAVSKTKTELLLQLFQFGEPRTQHFRARLQLAGAHLQPRPGAGG